MSEGQAKTDAVLVGRIDPRYDVAPAVVDNRLTTPGVPATITMIDSTAPRAPTSIKIQPTLLMLKPC